jgi:hypothetical protein
MSSASCDTSQRESPKSGRIGATIYFLAQGPPKVAYGVSGVRAHDVGLPQSCLLR